MNSISPDCAHIRGSRGIKLRSARVFMKGHFIFFLSILPDLIIGKQNRQVSDFE
jgi:hypothetical protein